jgi:hypothetical protein
VAIRAHPMASARLAIANARLGKRQIAAALAT